MSTIMYGEKLRDGEIEAKAMNGIACLVMNVIAMLASDAAFAMGIVMTARAGEGSVLSVLMIVIGALYGFMAGPLILIGLKVLKPNEAYVLTLFGQYCGTLKGPGFFWVNPFCIAVNPSAGMSSATTASIEQPLSTNAIAITKSNQIMREGKKISLKEMTLSNDRQKINDQLGNPIIIGIVVIWKVVNTAKAVFNVDNYKEYLSIQCDSALRDIVRLYPYDTASGDNEESLRGSSKEVAERLKNEIQSKVDVAGLEVSEARITHLSYAEEIAAVMLQRQQASAIIDARQMIVEGAVGMVEMALEKLSANNIVHLDEERKAAMVSNLLVVLCGNKDTQPVVNSGSLY